MSYSYATAKTVLSEGEKDRILAMWLSNDEHAANVDWDKATQAFGAASIESMRVSYRNLLRKIKKAGGKNGITAPSAAGNSLAPSTPKTPKTSKAKASRTPKRKAEDAGSDDDEDEDAPKTLRKKAAKNIARVENDDEDDEALVKTLKKPGRPRKTPVKVTKKTAAGKADADEDVADNINVASDKDESAEEDDKISKVVEEEDHDSEV